MTTAILSMLHESPTQNSATRTFRGDPVLRWTLSRLAQCKHLEQWAVLCWEDQLDAVMLIAEEHDVDVLAKGPRMPVPAIDSVTASRKWADGWRGGLVSACDFDVGFHGAWVKELADRVGATTVVLVPPSSALVDATLIDGLIERAAADTGHELIFSQAAPGLSGAVVKRSLLDRLATGSTHPGRFLHYMPDQPMLDPTSSYACVPVPTPVARTLNRFHLDSGRQIERVGGATISLNGQLVSTAAEDLVSRVSLQVLNPGAPREVVLEINTDRATSPIWWPGRHLKIERPRMTLGQAKTLFAQLGSCDDIRLTIGGVGDPLLHPEFTTILGATKDAGVHAVHVETDLVGSDDEVIVSLARSDIDVVSVHVPALTPQTYAHVMGVDAYARVLRNLTLFLRERARRQSGVPLVVPTFVKCTANIAEMDAWYDQWLRAVGSAVITGPSDCGGQIPAVAVADMAPPKRRACVRIASRLVVLSDGTVTSCEQDVLGGQAIGHLNASSITDLWTSRQAQLRLDHEQENWNRHSLCAGCKEWHRP